MKYETTQKLRTSSKNGSKLTSCIGDVWIVDSSYQQWKWSMKYETVHVIHLQKTLQQTYHLYWWCVHCWLQYHERKSSVRYETVHKLSISIKHWSKLTSFIDVWIVHSQYHQRKWSKKYKTVHKLSINSKHWSKLTSYINDLWIVDPEYQHKNEARIMK